MMPAHLDTIRARIDQRIGEVIGDAVMHGPEHSHPLVAKIYNWMRHYLDNGGRRMHGICVALAFEGCGGNIEAVVPVATALQLYHHHTLVHDDMYDQDTARRGWPTTHRVFERLFTVGEPGGCSGADLFVNHARRRGAIIAFAYGKICRAMAGRLIATAKFSASALLDVERAWEEHDVYDNIAQVLDVYHEHDAIRNPQQCLDGAYAKTGRLFELCAYAGARLADAGTARSEALQRWAGLSGLAYQIQDDLEDLSTRSEKGQGRGVGSDLLLAKPTFIYAEARERANPAQRELLDRWQRGKRGGLSIEDIADVLQRTGAIDAGRDKVRSLVEDANSAVGRGDAAFPLPIREKLIAFTEYFVSRDYWEREIESHDRQASHLMGAPA